MISNVRYKACLNNNRYHCDVAVDAGYRDGLLRTVPACETLCELGMKLVSYLMFYISAF